MDRISEYVIAAARYQAVFVAPDNAASVGLTIPQNLVGKYLNAVRVEYFVEYTNSTSQPFLSSVTCRVNEFTFGDFVNNNMHLCPIGVLINTTSMQLAFAFSANCVNNTNLDFRVYLYFSEEPKTLIEKV